MKNFIGRFHLLFHIIWPPFYWETVQVHVQSPILKVGQSCWTGTVDIFVISQPKWLKFGLQAHLFKMFGHAKFQLSISCTFKVMKVFVAYLVISTKCFITMKVQEIETWKFACPNISKKCAWRPNFSHFSWEMTKISTVPAQHRCPTLTDYFSTSK